LLCGAQILLADIRKKRLLRKVRSSGKTLNKGSLDAEKSRECCIYGLFGGGKGIICG